MVKNLFVLILFSLNLVHGLSQNLVANPNFEDRNTCTEFNVLCSYESWFMASDAIPVGKNMAGITVFNSSKRNVRQYLQTELLMELEKDSIYEIKMSVLAGDCIVNSLGIKFLENYICQERAQLITNPDVDFSLLMSQSNKKQQGKWIDLSFMYKARGGERFIIIGCFVSDKEQYRKFRNKNDKEKQYQNYLYFVNSVEVNAIYLDRLPEECEEVREHLYNFDYRHSYCRYVPYEYNSPFEENIDSLLPIASHPQIDSLVLGDVLFDFNSSLLKLEAKNYILELINELEIESITSIKIYGYTDSIGSVEFNEELSLKRAIAVKQFIIQNGFTIIPIETFGLGKLNPIAKNSTEEGRKKNRRIELLFYH